MIKRYDAEKDEYVELTQDYFNAMQSQFTNMMRHYSENDPEKYKDFRDNYINKVIKNV